MDQRTISVQANSPPAPYHASVHRGLDAFDRLADKWDAIVRYIPAPRFYHLFGWWRSLASTLVANGEEFLIVIMESGGQPICVVPLQLRKIRVAGLKVREVGTPSHSHIPMSDIICRPDLLRPALFRSLRSALASVSRWDVLTFRSVPAGSAASEYLTGDPMSIVSISHSCDYVDCAAPYEAIAAKYSRNLRSNLNKARNKLRQQGQVTYSATSVSTDLPRAFQEFLRVEASGWKGQAGTGTAIALDRTLLEFYQSLIDRLGPQGNIVINLLQLADRAIAAQFCIKVGETLYVLKLGYDESLAQLAPGNMLMEWVIQQASSNGSFRYLNMVNDPQWFKAWGTKGTPILNIRRYNRTIAGVALMLLGRGRRLVSAFAALIETWTRRHSKNMPR